MNNKILFGNNVGYKINNYLFKKKIITYLENNVDKFKLNNNVVCIEQDLLEIKNNDYITLANIVGDDYIFIATKLNEIFYVVLIEKKTLKNFENINYNDLNIISIRVRLKVDVYSGTIFDGRVVNLGGCSGFIINKVFKINGKDINSMSEGYKLADHFVKESYIVDSNMNCILFKLNRMYELNEIDKLINEKIENSKFKFSSLDFVSSDLSKTFRYYYNNQDYDIKVATMYGKKLSTDVIELFSKDENKKMKRIGIAHIPNIHISRYCNQHISETKLSTIKCNLDYRFKKWIPDEIIQKDIESTDYNDIINMMQDVISH